MDAPEWDERYRAADRLWPDGPNLFVADRLTPATPGTGVDVAGGEGRNAIWLSEQGWRMTSVDFSTEASTRGESAGSDVEFVIADALDWEPEDQVDLVLVAYLHLSLADLERVVRRTREWLRPGGEIFMIGHDLSNLEKGWGGPQYAEILWQVPTILSWLEGLVIVESSVVRRPVATEEGQMFARDALVRARAS